MKEQKDIHGMIYSMELGANKYGALIGHVPFLHKFLVGSDWTMRFVSWLFPNAPQVFVEMFKVNYLFYYSMVCRLTCRRSQIERWSSIASVKCQSRTRISYNGSPRT